MKCIRILRICLIALTACSASNRSDLSRTVKEILARPNDLEAVCEERGLEISGLMTSNLKYARSTLVEYLRRIDGDYRVKVIEGTTSDGEVAVSYFISSSTGTSRAEIQFLRHDEVWTLHDIILRDLK